MPKIRVLLADDHDVVAQGLAALLKDSFDLVGVVNDGRALVAAVDEHRPDVVVTDLSMPLLSGLDAVRQIRAAHPRVKFVVLTMHREIQLAADAFHAGVSGYLLKISPGEELISAIEQAATGRSYVSPLVAKDLISLLMETKGAKSAGEGTLTPRQREVLHLVAEGRTMKEVATILNISPRTAESHKYDIMAALGVNSTAALVQHAVRSKLLPE